MFAPAQAVTVCYCFVQRTAVSKQKCQNPGKTSNTVQRPTFDSSSHARARGARVCAESVLSVLQYIVYLTLSLSRIGVQHISAERSESRPTGLTPWRVVAPRSLAVLVRHGTAWHSERIYEHVSILLHIRRISPRTARWRTVRVYACDGHGEPLHQLHPGRVVSRHAVKLAMPLARCSVTGVAARVVSLSLYPLPPPLAADPSGTQRSLPSAELCQPATPSYY